MPKNLTLDPSTIHVWQGKTPTLELPHLLSEKERVRANKFILKKDKIKFINTRILLRLTLSKYIKTPPEKIQFLYNENGKPHIKNSLIEFNLSHSKNHTVIAIANGYPIGIDTEFRRSLPNCEAIAKRFFSPTEYAHLKSLQNQVQKTKFFFTVWTTKEAITKAKGDTLLKNIRIDYAEKSHWQLHFLTLKRHYQTTLAYKGSEQKKIQINDYDSF